MDTRPDDSPDAVRLPARLDPVRHDHPCPGGQPGAGPLLSRSGLRALDAAHHRRRRPHRVSVRDAVPPDPRDLAPAQRRRPGQQPRHPDLVGRRRHRHRRQRRLRRRQRLVQRGRRQQHRGRPRWCDHNEVSAPAYRQHHRPRGRSGDGRPADRPDGLHRLVDGPAPALRDSGERRVHRPGRLHAAARRHRGVHDAPSRRRPHRGRPGGHRPPSPRARGIRPA